MKQLQSRPCARPPLHLNGSFKDRISLGHTEHQAVHTVALGRDEIELQSSSKRDPIALGFSHEGVTMGTPAKPHCPVVNAVSSGKADALVQVKMPIINSNVEPRLSDGG